MLWSSSTKIIVFCLVLNVFHISFAQDLMCCSHATGSCRSACEKIALVQIASDLNFRNETIKEVEKYCSPQLLTFWECVNATLTDIAKGDKWYGRRCCPLPQSESCRKACATATTSFDLAQGCRQSDEIAFFRCLERQKEGDTCCRNATNLGCKNACFNIFKTKLTPNKAQRHLVQESCTAEPAILNCVKDFVKVTPAKNLHKHMPCCELSTNDKCQKSCRELLSNSSITIQEIIDGLEYHGCGPPLPQEYFWQCFFQPIEVHQNSQLAPSVEVSRIDRVGMDSAKWHCCQHAISDTCQRLCMRTFTKFWTTLWDDFLGKCLSAPTEERLRNCIDQVDEPCQLGCDGLSFCTNFNNRPLELFRSCNSLSDDAARNSMADWHFHRRITLPGDVVLPFGDAHCSPEVWKAIVCTLHTRPCARRSYSTQICQNVCVELLNKCIDWTQVDVALNADTVCAKLSLSNTTADCIDLEPFLSSANPLKEQLSSPCRGAPCEQHETCLIGHNMQKSYRCVPSCKLGEVSEYKVPESTMVRIPTPVNPIQKGCLKICKCTTNGIDECRPLPCIQFIPCLLGGQSHLHGSKFEIDCNSCTCFAGEVICTRHQCEVSLLSGRNRDYTTLPCNCPSHYIPVCGRNGITYASACLAKCAGLGDADFELGACDDACLGPGNKCALGQKCVSKPEVCLSLMHKPCRQYRCVNGTTDCRALASDPVCDLDNREHRNACALAVSNVRVGYHGRCLRGCDTKRVVCGINGKTYRSECAAIADFIAVDYVGACRAVGLLPGGEGVKARQCGGVACRPIAAGCWGVTPPGACCPLCGGAVRFLYSRKQIDRALYALDEREGGALTLRALLAALQRQVAVEQCALRGFLTLEADVFVAVVARGRGRLEAEACVREAEMLAHLVNGQSPRVVSELSLSALTVARLVHTLKSGVGAGGGGWGFGVGLLVCYLLR